MTTEPTLEPPHDEPIFVRAGSFIVFNQLGIKLELDVDLPTARYFAWLDVMIEELPRLVPGAQIAEKKYARAQPRLNTGVYYDNTDRDLVDIGAVLRTTCNKITHAFCAFKEPQDEHGVRRDQRHVFEGDAKRQLQDDPTSPESIAIVKRLLERTDIEQPGRYLLARYQIDPTTLSPSILVAQLRHPFFVWLDSRDALRCVMDRAVVSDLRAAPADRAERTFLELEIPIYPRIAPDVASDARLVRLMEVLADAAGRELRARPTALNKYQRAAKVLGLASHLA